MHSRKNNRRRLKSAGRGTPRRSRTTWYTLTNSMPSQRYSSNASASRTILVGLAIVLVITAFVLVGLNALRPAPAKISSGDPYAQGFQDARAMYQNLYPQVAQQSDATSLVATVQSNNGNSLTVLASSLDTDERIDGVSNTRTITLDANTKIQSTAPKAPDQFAKEMQSYLAKNSTSSATTPPAQFTFTNLKASDIKPGDVIIVQSNQSVRLLSSIPATSINVTSR